MPLKTLSPVILALLLTGCAGGAGTADGCAVFRPIYTVAGDRLTEPTAAQVLAHNLTGAAVCRWTPVH